MIFIKIMIHLLMNWKTGIYWSGTKLRFEFQKIRIINLFGIFYSSQEFLHNSRIYSKPLRFIATYNRILSASIDVNDSILWSKISLPFRLINIILFFQSIILLIKLFNKEWHIKKWTPWTSCEQNRKCD